MENLSGRSKAAPSFSTAPDGGKGVAFNPTPRRRGLMPLVLGLLLIFGLVGLGLYFTDGGIREAFGGFRNIGARTIDRELPGGSAPTPRAEEAAVPEPAEETPKQEEEKKEERELEPIEIALQQKRGVLRGWIVTENSEHPAGVEVRLEFENLIKDGQKGPDLRQKTAESGVFDFPKVPPGNWTIIAEASGFGAGTLTGVAVHSEQVTDNVEVLLPPALTLTGTVQTTAGSKLEGVKIVLMRKILNITHSDGELVRREVPYRETSSSSKGEFTIERAAPGAHVLVASFEGFADERIEVDLQREGKNIVTIELSPAANIGGLVRTTRGLPVAGASIVISDPDDKNFKAEAKTKADGSFIISGLRANRVYSLLAKAADFAPSGPHDIPAGRMENLILLESGGAITGVVRDLNSGATKADIAIMLESAGSTYKITGWKKSDSSGRYRFGDLPSGTYNLRVSSDKLTAEPKLGVKVKIPEETKDINFSIYPGETISGIVAEGETGTRISGAKVSITSKIGPEFLAQGKSEAVTDQSGTFKVINLPYGLYHLEATADGYLRYPGPEAQAEVRLLPGELSEPVTLLLSPGGTIAGYVVDANGAPVEGAVVQLYNTPGAKTRIDTGKFKALTKTGGDFEISGIPLDNEVNLTASAYAANIAIPNDESKTKQPARPSIGRAKGKSDPILLNSFLSTAEVTIRLGIGGTVNVVVREKGGKLIEGANVSIGHDGFPGDPPPPDWSGQTKIGGSAIFYSIPAGRATVSASKAGYIGANTRVEVADGQTFQVTLELEAGTTLTGVVYDDSGATIQEGYVDAHPQSGARGSGRGNIDRMGRFKIQGVSEGNFSLNVYATRQTPTGKHTIRKDYRGARASEDTVIYVPMNGQLDGAVYDQNSLEPITSARVNIVGRYAFYQKQMTEFRSGSGTQNPPGEFSFQSIPPGKYRVEVTAPNYLPVTLTDLEVVSPGQHWAGKIMLSQGATLKGRVVSDSTGEPVIGASISLNPPGPGGRTNGKGDFAIAAIEPDIYTLTITHADYLARKVEIVHIKKSEETDVGVVKLEEGGKLYGEVTDGFGRPVVGAIVTVRYTDKEDDKRVGKTDGGGVVRMQGLRPGVVIITVTGSFKRGKVTKSFERAISAATLARFDIVLAGELRLEGSVLGGVGSAQVEVYPLEADDIPVINGKVVAEMNGSYYKVDALVEGRYLVCASGNVNGKPLTFHDVVPLSYPGKSHSLQPPSGQIAGRIFDGNTQKPLQDMKVRLRGLSFPQSGVHGLRKYWEWTAKTDDIGFYSFGNVGPGKYEFVVTRPGSTDLSLEIINVTSGQRLRHDVLWSE